MTSKKKITLSFSKEKGRPGETVYISRRHAEDEMGYSDDEVEITANRDGTVFFSSGEAENFVYFYPEQRSHLDEALSHYSPAWKKAMEEYTRFVDGEVKDGSAKPLSGEEMILLFSVFDWLNKNFYKPAKRPEKYAG